MERDEEKPAAKPVSQIEIQNVALVKTPLHPSWGVQSARKIGKEDSSDESE